MSITKFIALAAVAATTTCVFADAKNVVVEFKTTSDYYADGTPVKDGEWYACCWSADGVFEGIKNDYTPIDPNDKILEMVSRAENGRCPYTTFEYDASIAQQGKFCVIMLDTREGGTGAVAGGETQPDRPANAAIASASYSVKAGSLSTTVTKTDAPNADWGATNPQPSKPARIVSINPSADGDNVEFIVDDTCPNVRYDLIAGAEPGKLDKKYVANEPKKGDGQVTITAPKDEAKFYKLTTAPMTK